MDYLIRNIYINILKYGDRYKTVDKKGDAVYICYYMKATLSIYSPLVSYTIMLKPKGNEQ